MLSILIGFCIIVYAIFVIQKRIREIKAGKYCSCGGECQGCHTNVCDFKKSI